jgi:hypothetical protein
VGKEGQGRIETKGIREVEEMVSSPLEAICSTSEREKFPYQ